MNAFLKRDSLIFVLVTLVIGIMSYSFITREFSFIVTLFIGLFSLAGIYIAYFFPKQFCYLIIVSAPLSVNITNFIEANNLSLSLPTEGMLGLLLLLSIIKALGGLKFDKSILKHPITILFFASILWMIIVSTFSTMPAISFKRIILKTSFILGFYLIFAHLFKEEKSRNKLFILYAIGLIIPIINALVLHSKFGFAQEESFEMTEPFYEDHTLYGACIAFIIPFVLLLTFNKIKKGPFSVISLFWITISVLLIIAEILSYSRAAWISLIIAFSILFLTFLKIKPKYYLYVGVIFVLIISLKFNSIYNSIKSGDSKQNDDNVELHLQTVTDLKSNASNLERVNRWVCAYRMFVDRPILGWGPGTYQFQYAQFQTEEFATEISSNTGDRGNSHSEYLTALSEEGFIGLILFITIMTLGLGKAISLLNNIEYYKNKIILYGFFLGLITFYSHGFFNTFSDYEKMSILVYGSLAGIVAIDVTKKSK